MPPQILRIVLLTAAIVVAYSIARVRLTPASFGKYGHYRAAALGEIATNPLHFAGAKACDECHHDTAALLSQHEHKGISCESCHGPAREHSENPDVNVPKRNDGACLRCHLESVGRPAWLKQIKSVADHYGDGCAGCHLPHQPNKSP